MINTNRFPAKDPDEILDYQFDWAGLDNNTGVSNWLAEGEAILSFTLTVPDGLDLVSSQLINSNTSVLFFVAGGTAGEEYEIECEIVTTDRIGSRTAILPVKNR